MKALISVIIPVYNVEKYVSKCITSVISQTYTNLEILLIDDGSTDGSGTICDSYIQKDKRVKVIHKENGGLSSARNCGLAHATGEYIAFIDSDDYVKPNFIETLHKRLVTDNSDIAVCNFDRTDENGNIISEFSLITPSEKKVLNQKEFWESFHDHSAVNIVAWNKLYKKTIFDSVRYFEGHIHEDVFIIPEIIERTEKISFVVESLYCYLKRSDSIVGKVKNEHILDIDKFLAELTLSEYFDKHNYIEFLSHHLLNNIIDISTDTSNIKLTKKQKLEIKKIQKKISVLYVKHQTDFSKKGLKARSYMTLFCFNIRLFYIVYSILQAIKKIKRTIIKHV